MAVQLFVHPKSAASRKAQRYFRERGIATHEVDLRSRGIAAGELRRFVDRFGVEALLDVDATAYREQGLAYLRASDDDWIERIVAEPRLLRLPLARCGGQLAVGEDRAAWERLAEAARG